MLPHSRAQRPSRLAAASRRCIFRARPHKSCAVLTACTTRCPRLAGGAVEAVPSSCLRARLVRAQELLELLEGERWCCSLVRAAAARDCAICIPPCC